MRLYGVDIGFGYTKAMTADKSPVVIPSIVGSPDAPSYRSDIGDRMKIAPVTLNGHSYLIGEAAKRFSRFHYRVFDSSFTQSPYYLLLFASALLQLDDSPAEPAAVVTGLPVSRYSEEWARELKDLLAKNHKLRTASGETNLNVEKAKVVPQPFGSFFDFKLDSTGRLKDLSRIHDKVAIVDIGFQTTDLALAAPHFVEEASGSLETGVRSVVERVRRDLSRQRSLNLDIAEAEEAVRTKTVKIFGEKADISDLIARSAREVAEEILSYARTLWGRGQKIETLILTGGGTHLFKDYFKEYPNLHVPHDPALANVRGYLKLARRTKWS